MPYNASDFTGTFWTITDGDFYVSTIGNDISGTGHPKNPFLTVAKAFEMAINGEKIVIGPYEYVAFSNEITGEAGGSEMPCRLATTGNIALHIGGLMTIDGTLTVGGDRILVWRQDNATENGIYIVSVGSWQRATSFDSPENMIGGKLIPVAEGAVHGKEIFQFVTSGAITIGVTPLLFQQAAITDWGEIQGTLTDQEDLTSYIDGLLVDKQDAHPSLSSIAALGTAANTMIFTTAANSYTTTTISEFGRSLVAAADDSAARSTLALGTLATLSAINNDHWSGTPLSIANGGTGANDDVTARFNLGVSIGTHVQAYSNDLHAIAELTGSGFMKRTGSGEAALITDNSTNWNTAFGWGNHAIAGYELASNKGAANGYAPLGADTKIATGYLPDVILGQLVYGGSFNGTTALATLSNNAKAKLGTASNTITLTNNSTAVTGYGDNEGIFYIASTGGTFAGLPFETGDWLIATGSAWQKIDNTDAVSTVFGRSGAVIANESDYQAYYPRLSQSYSNPSWITALAWSKISGTPTTLAGYGITDAQASDADLSAIAALGFTSTAFLKKTAANTWALDTNTYLTGNQTITLTGAITGSGTTSLFTVIANNAVTSTAIDAGAVISTKLGNGAVTYEKIQIATGLSVLGNAVNSSGIMNPIVAGTDGHVLRRSGANLGFGTIGNASIADVAWGKITSTPTTLAGYGITDSQAYDADLAAIAGLTSAANKIIRFTGSGTADFLDFDTDSTLAANSNTRIASQAAVKSYVDNLISGLKWKSSVLCATTSNITLSNTQTIDGVSATVGSRVLVKNQSTSSQNGIYVVALGSWTRTGDADSGAELVSATVFVEQGTVNGDTQWTCTNNAITLGSTAIVFAQVSGSGTYSAGMGLSLTGNQFAISNPELLAIALLSSSANTLAYFTGAGTAALTTLTSFGRSLLDDSDATTARTTLGLGSLATLSTISETIIVAVSDEVSNLIAGLAKVTFRMPYAMTLESISASVNTAPTGANIVVDVNRNGSTILSTKLSIDANEKTSATAATPAVISSATLELDSEITIDIDAVGSTLTGKGLKVTLNGVRA